jgi:SOS-response transcriptional repressor LexA
MDMEPMGVKLRRQRRRLGLTLDELAGRTGISKPYLSLIETGRVPNPPSDEKLTKLEQTLGFKTGELLTQAHLHRTPRDVRAMLSKLLSEAGVGGRESAEKTVSPDSRLPTPPDSRLASSVPLDELYMTGMLRQFVDRSAGNVETIPTNVVPVINRVSAGYPKDFTDLNYPKGVADAYVSSPDVNDPDAFAARVFGDSMTPKYREGDIVIFSPKAAVKNGDDAFVRFADTNQTTFKRVFYESDDKGSGVIRLQPRNEKYRPQTISAEKLSGVWRAVFKYQSVDDG